MGQFDNLKRRIRKKIEIVEDQEDKDIYLLMIDIVTALEYATIRKKK